MTLYFVVGRRHKVCYERTAFGADEVVEGLVGRFSSIRLVFDVVYGFTLKFVGQALVAYVVVGGIGGRFLLYVTTVFGLY